MTLNRPEDSAATWQPPKFDALQQDLTRLAQPPQIVPPNADGPGAARFRLLGTYEEPSTGRKVYHWQVEYYETRGGLNHQHGRLEQDHSKLGDSNLDTRWEDHLILNQLTTEQTTVDDGTGSRLICHANAFGQLVISTSEDVGGVSTLVVTETSATNPALTSIAYTAGGNQIFCLVPVTINGTTYLAVGRGGAGGIDLLNSSLTSATTMHVSTSGTYGIIVNPFGDLLIKGGGSIMNLPAGSATSDAPNSVVDDIPAGGWAMGLLGLGGGNLRAWWNWPRFEATGGYSPHPYYALELDGTYNTYPGTVYSTDLSGDDPRELVMPLKRVVHSVICRDAIIGSDSERIIMHNGRSIRDLRIFRDRPADSDRTLRIAGMWVKDTDLYVEVNEIASTGGAGNTRRWIEYYDFAWDAWHKVTTEQTIGTTGIQSYVAGGSLPVSQQTGYLHTRTRGGTDGSWWRVFQPPPGTNPYSLRFTEGATAGTGVEFESTGTVTWCSVQLPGFAGWPSVVSRLIFMGDVGAGGDNATVRFRIGDVDTHEDHEAAYEEVTLYADDAHRHQNIPIDSTATFYHLGVQVTVTRDSSTRLTPNAIPFIIEGYTFVDEPQDVPMFRYA